MPHSRSCATRGCQSQATRRGRHGTNPPGVCWQRLDSYSYPSSRSLNNSLPVAKTLVTSVDRDRQDVSANLGAALATDVVRRSHGKQTDSADPNPIDKALTRLNETPESDQPSTGYPGALSVRSREGSKYVQIVVLLGQLSNLSELLKGQVGTSFDHAPQQESAGSQPRLKLYQVEELVRLYVDGASSAELQERYGIHNDTVRAHLKRNGVTPRSGRPFKLTEDELRTTVKRKASGESFGSLARELGVDRKTLRNALERLASL